MSDFLGRYISWRAFALGVVLAMAGASVTGWLVTERNNFPNFVRMYRPITPESLYYPTARQIAALVNDKYTPGKTIVLVGGSSVLRGVSQRTDHVWTSVLQAQLGPRYVVLNLAMNGGGGPGMASYMTEMLTKSGHPAILAADMLPNTWQPDSPNQEYRYFYYEAEARGYLIPNGPRSAYLSANVDDRRRAFKIRAISNLGLNYAEFWHYLGTCCFFTVYNSLVLDPWGPRGQVPDNENPEPGFLMKTAPEDRDAAEMRIERSLAQMKLDCVAETTGFGIAFPKQIRDRTILVMTGQAPFYLDRLTPQERDSVHQYYQEWSRCIESNGIVAASADRLLVDDDHYDRVHLNEQGGTRLAVFLAPIIRNKAKELNYPD